MPPQKRRRWVGPHAMDGDDDTKSPAAAFAKSCFAFSAQSLEALCPGLTSIEVKVPKLAPLTADAAATTATTTTTTTTDMATAASVASKPDRWWVRLNNVSRDVAVNAKVQPLLPKGARPRNTWRESHGIVYLPAASYESAVELAEREVPKLFDGKVVAHAVPDEVLEAEKDMRDANHSVATKAYPPLCFVLPSEEVAAQRREQVFEILEEIRPIS